MSSRLIKAGRVAAIVFALACLAAATACTRAQTQSQPPAQADRGSASDRLVSAQDQVRASLDAIDRDARFARDDATLAEVASRLQPLRDELAKQIAALEPRLAQVDVRLKQLGDAPAANAPPEDPALAAERTRLTAERGELDTDLKQARLLALRAQQDDERISQRRRTLVTNLLLARPAALFDPTFWRDTGSAAVDEIAGVGDLLRAAWTLATNKIGIIALASATAVIVACAIIVLWLTRAWRRRLVARPAETRFARALAGVIELAGIALIAPAVVIVAVLAFESFGVVTSPLASMGYGIALAVVVARVGRGAALALFAPDMPGRRLAGVDDHEARVFTDHLTWAARVLALAVAINAMHRATTAPLTLTIATAALMSLAVAAVAIHLLAAFPEHGEDDGRVHLPGLRMVLWLVVITVLVALATGYIWLAGFVATRFVAMLAVLCALYVVLVFVDTLFTEVLTGGTAVGRSLAAMFGITPRSLELTGTLLSAVLRVVIVLVTLPPVLGPWGVFASDLFDFVQQITSGFRIAGITISLAAIVTAFVWLVAGVLVARGAQRWLETRFMPRTGIDAGLQHSVATLVGWTLLIAAVAIALSHVGIDAQQIALIAGALSVGIGFGLQSVVSNFVSGIILLAERPIRVGDWVVVKNEEGIVRRISVRATEIETFDRASVIIPNSDFITGAVKNLTHTDAMGRITIKVRVSYDSDIDTVRDALIGCACDNAQVLQTPPPRVFLIAFGDISIELELRCIVANVNYGLTVKSDLQTAILQKFKAAGIKMSAMPHEAHVPGVGMAPKGVVPP